MTDVTIDRGQDEVELPAADEQLVRELTDRARAALALLGQLNAACAAASDLEQAPGCSPRRSSRCARCGWPAEGFLTGWAVD